MKKQGSDDEKKKKAPPAAAASGSSNTAAAVGRVHDDPNDNDMGIASRWQTIEQLVSIFAYPSETAAQAVDAVGFDVTACYNYILDNNLADDAGGPIVPIDSCPHLTKHVQIHANNLAESIGGNQRPQDASCSHRLGKQSSNKKKAGVSLKQDMEEDGSCPSHENWMCLECGAIRCSRYQNGHCRMHWESTVQNDGDGEGHCVAISFSDLSIWCYVCSAYVKHPTLLSPLLSVLERLKFQQTMELKNVVED
jgi:uncharacterized UBP type Zn finger protein